MNQIKPYLFWIISGVLLLVLLVLGLFVLSPTDETIDGTARDAYAVKDLLDQESKKLAQLTARAKRGDPDRVFDPQEAADIDTLTNDYLLTEEWRTVIDPHVEKYDLQLKALRQDLIDRSAMLRKDVSADHGKLPWYTAYEKQTAELVVRLRDARALLVSEGTSRTQFTAPGAFSGPGGGPAGGAGGAGGGKTGEDPLSPQTGSRIRDVLGLLTTTSLPEATEHDLLTKRFRIVEAVAGGVLASDAEALPNPIVDSEGAPRARAAITSWEWKAESGELLEGAIAGYASPLRCTVALQGTEAALSAALAKLESLERPVLIVLGATFARIDRSPSGSRKPRLANGDAVLAPATLSVDLLVLDFGQMPDLTSVAVGQAGPAPTGPRGLGPNGPGPFGPNGPPPGGMPPGAMPPDPEGSPSGRRGTGMSEDN